MTTIRDLRDAEAFAAAYEPSEDDHPDLESRVVMYRRAAASGSKPAEAVHARTLMRFVGHLGLDMPDAGDMGPSKDELKDRARELGVPVSGSKAELASRIAAAEAENES